MRGRGNQVKHLLAYIGVEYEFKQYEVGGPPDFSRQAWKDEKFELGLDFPNLPYFIDSDGTKLTEYRAIMKYIAKKW